MTRRILRLISMGRMDSLKQISAESALCNRWYCLNISKPFKTSLHLVIFCFLIVALRTQSAIVKNIFLSLQKWLQLIKGTQPSAFDVLCNLLFMFSFIFGKGCLICIEGAGAIRSGSVVYYGTHINSDHPLSDICSQHRSICSSGWQASKLTGPELWSSWLHVETHKIKNLHRHSLC